MYFIIVTDLCPSRYCNEVNYKFLIIVTNSIYLQRCKPNNPFGKNTDSFAEYHNLILNYGYGPIFAKMCFGKNMLEWYRVLTATMKWTPSESINIMVNEFACSIFHQDFTCSSQLNMSCRNLYQSTVAGEWVVRKPSI